MSLVTLLAALAVLATTGYAVYAAAAKPADFSLTATASQSVVPGEAGVYTVTMTPLNGFSGSVNLTVAGLPKSTQATFVTNPLTTSKASTSMIVETGSAAPVGTYTLTITGMSGSLTHSVTAQLKIVASAPFTLDETPTVNQGVAPGGAAVWTVVVRRSSGFTGSVTLSTNSDLPSGVTASFSPNPVSSSGTTSTLTLQTSSSTPQGSYPFAIHGVSGTSSTWIRATLNVGTFSLSASPSSQTVVAGNGTTYGVTVNRSFFTADMNLSVSGLPSGATGSFSPNPVPGAGSSSTLTVTTSPTVTPGSYTLTISGTGGTPAQTKTTQVTLLVGTFSLSATPTSGTVAAGSGTTYGVTISRTTYFVANVNLGVSGLPNGASGSFSPNPVGGPSGTSSTLTIATTAPTVQPGAYTLTISGSAGSPPQTKSTQVTLVVTLPPAPPRPSIGSKPSNPTTATGASFSFSDGQAGVTFRCKLDGGVYAGCSSPASYSSLSWDSHTFSVVAVDGYNQQSSPATYTWQINPLDFTISGNVAGQLFPGAAATPLNLTLYNPNGSSLPVVGLTVVVTGVSAPNATQALPCDANDYAASPYSGGGFSLPPGTSTLASLGIPQSQWPTVRMLDRIANQNGCKGAAISLSYGGSAHP
jgi:hypothetical protein